MRIAIISDIHGNRTALEAVLADLRQTSPDLILHGGDLSHAGASPSHIVDQIRDLGWPGVLGNTDEMLYEPGSLIAFASQSPLQFQPILAAVAEMAAWSRSVLGEARCNWFRGLPRVQIQEQVALVHASPNDLWRAPNVEASDEELESVYKPLGRTIAVYAHIHRPFIRTIAGLTIINTGSVGLPHDGDPRASYLLLDNGLPQIRRVEYDVEKEVNAVMGSGIPHAESIAGTIRTGRFQTP